MAARVCVCLHIHKGAAAVYFAGHNASIVLPCGAALTAHEDDDDCDEDRSHALIKCQTTPSGDSVRACLAWRKRGSGRRALCPQPCHPVNCCVLARAGCSAAARMDARPRAPSIFRILLTSSVAHAAHSSKRSARLAARCACHSGLATPSLLAPCTQLLAGAAPC